MTSKEALSSLKEEYYIENNEHIITFHANDDRLKIIEKDLEVLEILKEHFQISDYGQWYIDMQESDFDFKSECTEEEWINSPQRKIKIWLAK